ncbi:MAG: thioredoxin domain-containing protein [Devosiaceae bacterium]|nr:thioredoxin domain-containing protein [Devosiaceae bacterium]
MTHLIKYFFLPLFLILGIGSASHAQQQPEMYVVIFRADWCGPCKIVEPNLDRALKQLNDPSIKVVVIDVTDSPRIERSAHIAFDHQIAAQYNKWYGVTGFAAMIDADTKNTLGCVNMMYDAGAMASHIRNLKTYALANQPSFDITCPAPNAPR